LRQWGIKRSGLMRLLALVASWWQSAHNAILFAMSTGHPSRLLVPRVFIVIHLHAARAAEDVVCKNAKGVVFTTPFYYLSY